MRERLKIMEAFQAVENSYRLFSQGKTIASPTTSMSVRSGMFYSFPAFIDGSPIFISKQATDYRDNSSRGLPTVHPYILVFDSETGVLDSIIEGRYFAATRTALSSAVGVKHLAKHPKRIAIFGTGVQGRSHVRVLSKLFPTIEEIRLFSPASAHVEQAVSELQSETSNVLIAASSARDAVLDADVIVTATSSKTPVFNHTDLKMGALVIGVGAMKNDQEIPTETVSSSQVVVDALSNVVMYDEIRLAQNMNKNLKVLGEIGALIDKNVKIHLGMTTIFKHHGLPVTDAALAETLL